MIFSEKILEYVHPGDRVLDLGAGAGKFSKDSLDHQAKVTAVDFHEPPNQSSEIDWHAVDVKDFIAGLRDTDQFNLIYSRNLIQFLDADWVKGTLMPKLQKHLLPEGIIAIQTFYRDPDPSFDRPVSSLYTVADLEEMLAPMKILVAKTFNKVTPDMQGTPRRFFVTNIIAQKS